MSWINLLTDNRSIKAIYGENVPSLNKVEIHKILLDRDGPVVAIRIDLTEFPKKPPEKWIKSGFNTVQIELRAIDIELLKIEGLETNMICDLSLSKVDDSCKLVIDNPNFKVNIKAKFLSLSYISAYVDGLKESN